MGLRAEIGSVRQELEKLNSYSNYVRLAKSNDLGPNLQWALNPLLKGPKKTLIIPVISTYSSSSHSDGIFMLDLQIPSAASFTINLKPFWQDNYQGQHLAVRVNQIHTACVVGIYDSIIDLPLPDYKATTIKAKQVGQDISNQPTKTKLTLIRELISFVKKGSSI